MVLKRPTVRAYFSDRISFAGIGKERDQWWGGLAANVDTDGKATLSGYSIA